MPPRKVLDDFAVYAFDRLGGYHHALRTQIHKPCEFGSDGRFAVIAFAVNPQCPSAPVSGLYAVGGVFREIDHRQRNIGGQGIVRQRFFSDLLQEIKHGSIRGLAAWRHRSAP